MQEKVFDIIVIGSGSGGLSIGLFMAKAGFAVLMVSKSDADIGGDCLNDGCVPSKALIHVAKIAHAAKEAAAFGLEVTGKVNIKKAVEYVYTRQEVIREHDNAGWLKEQGVHVALGDAFFTGRNEIEVDGKRYGAKKIVIATGSKPRTLAVPGIEKIRYYDNESVFDIEKLHERLLVIGGGPIGIEIAQAMSRLGSKVIVVHGKKKVLEHDDVAVTDILTQQLKNEGIEFLLDSKVESFPTANNALVRIAGQAAVSVSFDAAFIAVGRELNTKTLQLHHAGIEVHKNKIISDKYLKTTNNDVFVCGDIAGDLMFSHAAEFHARIILNNLFSPLKQKLNNDHMSWVTFTDPELATFGLSEKQLKDRGIVYERLEHSFAEDDRAVVDNFPYAKAVFFISKGGILRKQKLLGGTMVAPNAGELVQELILANSNGLSINSIFNKIYPYPVASRINQAVVVQYKSKGLTAVVKKLLHAAFKIFS